MPIFILLNKCLRPNLVPFDKENYKQGYYIFWPDLAKVYYAEVITWYLVLG